MKRKLTIVSLGVVLAGILISFTANKVNNNISIAQVNSVSEIFVIKNSKTVSLPIESIDKIHKFKTNEKRDGFRCVTTRAGSATDYGPYRELYFLFENASEMPNRTAVFKVGNSASINSFKKISNSKYEIQGVMFSHNGFFTKEEVVITIDASDIISQENKQDEDNTFYEGNLSSKIVVCIESK